MPVLAVGPAGKGRVLAFGVDTSWRMGLTTAGQQGDASAYERFWDRALRWLVHDPTLEPSLIESDRERYGPGAPIVARARLRDARYQPLADRTVTLGVVDGAGHLLGHAEVQVDGEGGARAQLASPRTPGAYRLVASEPRDGSVLAEEGILVEASGNELADPRPSPENLRALSKATGGRYHTEGATVRLAELDRSRARSLGTSTSAPFSSPWFVALLVALSALEWALRRAWSLR